MYLFSDQAGKQSTTYNPYDSEKQMKTHFPQLLSNLPVRQRKSI